MAGGREFVNTTRKYHCAPVPLAIARAKVTNHKTMGWYFDMLEDTLKENGIFNNSTIVMKLGCHWTQRVSKWLRKQGISSISGDTITQITVLACTCANGIALPPLVIVNRKTLNPEMTVREIPGTLYELSKTGWINWELVIMARRAIPMIAFPRVRTIIIYNYIYIFLCHLREYALYT